MVEKKKKEGRGKSEEKAEQIPEMTQEEAEIEMQRFFTALEEKVKGIPQEEIERGAQKVKDFVDGRIGWADLFDFTPDMLFRLAEYGFMQFKQGRYVDAERVFKGLAILDWNNAYYHSVLGSILQRQRRYGEAIAEYTQALDLDPKDIVSFTNRGEIFMHHGLMDEAREDFKHAMNLDPDSANRFANRARMLTEQIKRIQAEKKKPEVRGQT
jgi:tetratricopeptide (TPR) repeat protein